jgi:acetaldehyde dehydrogenase (acetylating)
VNTPSPQGSTGITTNVFPSMTLGCGAMAGNSTSDNVGPLNLIDIKRLAYTVRTPAEAFEMPLDYDKAPDAVSIAGGAAGGGEVIDRAAVVSAVERYLAARGIGTAPAPSCGCSKPEPAAPPAVQPAAQPAVRESVVASVAAEVVDRFLSLRGAPKSGGYS